MNPSKIILNPVRMRIIQHLLLNENATTNDIITQIDDVPRTTLYRHLKLLEDNNFIKVIRENKVRGTVEKVYSINKNKEMNEIQTPSDAANFFFLGLLSDFQKYFAKEGSDPQKDMLMFRSVTLLMSDDEFIEFSKEIGETIEKYMNNKMTAERKIRKISTISSPNIE